MTRDTAVLGGTAAKKDSIDQDDSGSRVSDDDSQHLMITKKTEFTVEMDRASLVREKGRLDHQVHERHWSLGNS